MREIKISQETASRWYNGTDSELKALALQTYPELAVKELPKKWEELKRVEGYFVYGDSDVEYAKESVCKINRNIFATKEQAEASIAMAQLSQLMAVYNDSWVADWTDEKCKFVIYFQKNKFVVSNSIGVYRFMNFKNEETAELFLENFKDLIQTAKPLL